MDSPPEQMKLRVARTIKWNFIDKFLSIILYTVTGIILARVLPNSDFGLIGAALAFSAFATLLIDSGFSSALLQKKHVSTLDYSSVLWFNIAISLVIYVILYFLSPSIAKFFQNDERLIPVCRVIFLTFIFNATAVVQTNRLLKQMNVRMLAVSNGCALFVSSVVAIWMALNGYGVWSLVWQSILQSVIKSGVLWLTGNWFPMLSFSFGRLKSFSRIGFSMMGSTFLNTLFKNIYAFIIGNRAGVLPLSYYTQAEKWSTMGIASVSQIFAQSFLPALSEYQDSPEKFSNSIGKMNRTTSYLLFPFCGLLIVAAPAIFHFLFDQKWDSSIYLFQLLLVRGIFIVLTSIYNNYILALGKAKLIVKTELIRDIIAIAAIFATWNYISLEKPNELTYGIAILLWGQIIASFISWLITLTVSSRLTTRKVRQFIYDSLPYFLISVAVSFCVWTAGNFIQLPFPLLIVQLCGGAVLYMGICYAIGSKEQKDIVMFFFNKMKR